MAIRPDVDCRPGAPSRSRAPNASDSKLIMDDAGRTYLVASCIDWILVGVLGWAAARWLGLTGWVAAAVVGAWIAKDLLMYRSMRRYYEAQPSERRIVGEEGVTLCRLDPSGFVRVHGEIWQAHMEADEHPLEEGAPIRVCDVTGLVLRVERLRRPRGARLMGEIQRPPR
jgi:membrane protein implicated in regulation of membrane protease activity